MIYANPEKSLKDETFTDSKLMWVLENYSRFIRPGAKRLGVSSFNAKGVLVSEGDTDPYALMISAYENMDEIPVVVVINYSDKDRSFELNWKGTAPATWIPYCTNDMTDANLKPLPKIKYGKEILVPARSVISYVGNK